ncbi:PREDICTED: uncharacterized protein K02A2.6-like [Vollenhovia emeryi]|uniref:uncharacterized protein K02A2.6-like n=1 Tax=Vollenhovia emeryi TaxID=411798 RepID=UPI0005F5418B|nr:PREDICTED: uncharacterized protein K02A2.6-like [Vollenhovia emeryi]
MARRKELVNLQTQVAQQNSSLQQQQAVIQQLLERQNLQVPNAASGNGESARDVKAKNLADSIEPFAYDPNDNATFESWYKRYETIFTTEIEGWTEPEKIRLLMRKFTRSDYQRFADSVLPRVPTDLTLQEAAKLLKSMFGYSETKFSMRFKCFDIRMEDSATYGEYGARINKLGEKFGVANFSADDLKNLLFISGLKDPRHADEAARAAIAKLTVSDLINETQNIITLKKDKLEVCEASSNITEVNAIQNSRRGNKKKQNPPSAGSSSLNRVSSRKASRPCKFCGGDHWDCDCSFKDKQCLSCLATGHKSGFCKSAADALRCETENLRRKLQKHESEVNKIASKQIANPSNRKFITPRINGSRVRLQLDSASDITIISTENWKKIGKPSLSGPDVTPGSASGHQRLGIVSVPYELQWQRKYRELLRYSSSKSLRH